MCLKRERMSTSVVWAGLVAALSLLSAAPASASVESYVREALNANPGLQAELEDAVASAGALEEARAQRLPQLSFNARYTRAEGGRSIDFPAGDLLNPVYATLNSLTAGTPGATNFPAIENQSVPLLRRREQDTRLSLSTPLFAPAIVALVDVRAAELRADQAQTEAAARQLVRALKGAYFGALQARAQVGILEASLGTLAENVRVSRALLDAGKVTRDEGLRAEAERLAAVQDLDAARTVLGDALRQLNWLRGAELDAELRLDDPLTLPLPPPAAPDGTRDPTLRQLEASVEAARAGERLARADWLPTLSLGADAGYEGEEYEFDDEHDFATVSLVASWTLFDSGARRAARDRARAQATALRHRQTDLDRQLELARRSADENLATALRGVETAGARLSAAEEAFRIAERKRGAGSLNQVDFIDAERTRTQARLGRVLAHCAALDRAAEREYAYSSYPLPDRWLADAAPSGGTR